MIPPAQVTINIYPDMISVKIALTVKCLSGLREAAAHAQKVHSPSGLFGLWVKRKDGLF